MRRLRIVRNGATWLHSGSDSFADSAVGLVSAHVGARHPGHGRSVSSRSSGITPDERQTSPAKSADTGAPVAAYAYMDAFRFMLALAVAFGHVWALFIRDYQPTADTGVNILYFAAGFAHPGVVMFFVLSGYWISKSVIGRAEAGWRWSGYLIDRLSRLLVVLIPALAIGGALDAAALYLMHSPTHLGETDTYVLKTDVAANLAPDVLLGNLLFLQGILARPFGSNGPLWSLAYEFWYYIWFPAIFLTYRRRRLSAALIALVLALLAPELMFGFISWSCGSLLFFLEARLRQKGARVTSLARRLLLPAAMLFSIILVWGRTGDFSYEDPMLAAGFSAFLLALLLANPAPFRGIAALAAYGAGASFSLYAIHFPIMAFAAGLFVGAQRFAPNSSSIGLAALVLLTTVGAAWLFSRATESRTNTVRRAARGILAGR